VRVNHSDLKLVGTSTPSWVVAQLVTAGVDESIGEKRNCTVAVDDGVVDFTARSQKFVLQRFVCDLHNVFARWVGGVVFSFSHGGVYSLTATGANIVDIGCAVISQL
jgi:hypothetical protein